MELYECFSRNQHKKTNLRHSFHFEEKNSSKALYGYILSINISSFKITFKQEY